MVKPFAGDFDSEKKDIYSIAVYNSHDVVNLFCCVIPIICKA